MIPHSKPYLTETDFEATRRLVASGMLAKGAISSKLENYLKETFTCHHAILTASGATALVDALRLQDLAPNSRVVLPSYVCESVLLAVETANCIPVLCDIGPNWTMTEASIRQSVTDSFDAIIAVSIFGIDCNIAELRNFGVPIIHDCCQSPAPLWDLKSNADIGDVIVLSFHATKYLAGGHGGAALFVNEYPLKAKKAEEYLLGARLLSAMTDLQAQLVLTQFEQFETLYAKRQELAKRYFEELPNFCTENLKNIISSNEALWGRLFRFVLSVPQLDFQEAQILFTRFGVSVRRGVDELLHRKLELDDRNFLNTNHSFSTTLSIPFYPALLEDEAKKVIDAVNKVFEV